MCCECLSALTETQTLSDGSLVRSELIHCADRLVSANPVAMRGFTGGTVSLCSCSGWDASGMGGMRGTDRIWGMALHAEEIIYVM